MSIKMTRQGANARALVAGWTHEAGARLKAAIKHKGLRQEDVAKDAAITRQYLAAVLSGKTTPSDVTLRRVCEVIGVTLFEIIEGKPPSPFGEPNKSQPLAGDVRIGSDDYSLVKHYQVDASAGPGRYPLSEAPVSGVAFARSWLIKRGIAADMAGLVAVKGDSMAPTIQDGASVLVHMAECMVKKTGVYVFNRFGEVCIKRIVPVDVGQDGLAKTLVITSDNPEYPPEVVTGAALNELRIIGRVRSVLADL